MKTIRQFEKYRITRIDYSQACGCVEMHIRGDCWISIGITVKRDLSISDDDLADAVEDYWKRDSEAWASMDRGYADAQRFG